MGVGKESGRGRSDSQGARSEEKEAQAWFLRALLWLRNPHPRVGERRGRGKRRALSGGQAAQSKAVLVTDPSPPSPSPGAGLSGFLFGGENQQNLARQKGEEERAGLAVLAGLAGLAAARVPLPGPDPNALAPAVPAAGVREREPGGPAVRAH